jgi:hypothetical protein
MSALVYFIVFGICSFDVVQVMLFVSDLETAEGTVNICDSQLHGMTPFSTYPLTFQRQHNAAQPGMTAAAAAHLSI